jgi:hypothetical protein
VVGVATGVAVTVVVDCVCWVVVDCVCWVLVDCVCWVAVCWSAIDVVVAAKVLIPEKHSIRTSVVHIKADLS